MRTIPEMRTRSSRDGMGCLSIALWLAGAGVTTTWVHAGGGYEWPLAFFAVWASTVCLMYVVALLPGRGFRASTPEVLKALQCGVLSVPIYLVGLLLLAFWPVTVTIGFLFALCRFATASSHQSAAY